MQRFGVFFGLAAFAMAFAAPAAAQQKLTVITFSGATNLPVWIAVDKGFFKKEGIDVQHEVTRGSQQVMEGLMSGKYQFGSAALDNTIAYVEGQGDVKIDNFDLVAILGVQDMTQLTRLYYSSNFLYLQSLTMLAFMYLILVVLLTRLVRLMEARLHKAYAR